MSDLSKYESGLRLAIMRQPRVETEDHSGKLSLFFEAYIAEGYAAMQIVPLPEVPPGTRFNVSGLEGRPCWVEVDLSANRILFREWWKD